MERGAGLQRSPEQKRGPSWGLVGKGPLTYATLPFHQTKMNDRRAWPHRRRLPLQPPPSQDGGLPARGPSAPALPPPRQLAAEPGSPSLGSRPSSPPARPVAGPLPICRRAQGGARGAGARSPPTSPEGEESFCSARLRRASPGWVLGLGGCGWLTFPLWCPTLSPGSFLGTRGEEDRSARAHLGRPGRPLTADRILIPRGRVKRPATRFRSA